MREQVQQLVHAQPLDCVASAPALALSAWNSRAIASKVFAAASCCGLPVLCLRLFAVFWFTVSAGYCQKYRKKDRDEMVCRETV